MPAGWHLIPAMNRDRLVENSVVMIRSVIGTVVALLACRMAGDRLRESILAARGYRAHNLDGHFLLTAEKVTVSSWAGLRNGRQVTVSCRASSRDRRAELLVVRVRDTMQVNRPRCGMQFALQSIGLTDSNVDGSGSVSFTVHSSAATEPLSSALVPCSGSCVIVATYRSHGNYKFAPSASPGNSGLNRPPTRH